MAKTGTIVQQECPLPGLQNAMNRVTIICIGTIYGDTSCSASTLRVIKGGAI